MPAVFLAAMRYIAFVLLGYAIAAPGEYIVQALLGGKPWSFFSGVLWLNYGLLFTLAYLVVLLVRRLAGDPERAMAFAYPLFVILGMLFEWYALGNVPDQSNWFARAGMFSYWSSLYGYLILVHYFQYAGRKVRYSLALIGLFVLVSVTDATLLTLHTVSLATGWELEVLSYGILALSFMVAWFRTVPSKRLVLVSIASAVGLFGAAHLVYSILRDPAQPFRLFISGR